MYGVFQGRVQRGRQIGCRLGFPTANVPIDEEEDVRDGVYAVTVEIDGEVHNGIANVGPKPTVEDSGQRLVEVYIFNFCNDIYGKQIKVKLIEYIRAIAKFGSLEELKERIEKDEVTAEQFFKNKHNSI